jgi:hypothetical protein
MSNLKKEDCIYQSFYFKNEIKKYFYPGNGFLQYSKDMDIVESFGLALSMFGDKEAFMPRLVDKIEELLGEGNFIYDYWEFGEEDFSLYWHIRKSVYVEKLNLIAEWVRFEELDDFVFFSFNQHVL